MNHVRRRFQKEIDTERVIIVRGKSKAAYGVVQAVNQFCIKHDW